MRRCGARGGRCAAGVHLPTWCRTRSATAGRSDCIRTALRGDAAAVVHRIRSARRRCGRGGRGVSGGRLRVPLRGTMDGRAGSGCARAAPARGRRSRARGGAACRARRARHARGTDHCFRCAPRRDRRRIGRRQRAPRFIGRGRKWLMRRCATADREFSTCCSPRSSATSRRRRLSAPGAGPRAVAAVVSPSGAVHHRLPGALGRRARQAAAAAARADGLPARALAGARARRARRQGALRRVVRAGRVASRRCGQRLPSPGDSRRRARAARAVQRRRARQGSDPRG